MNKINETTLDYVVGEQHYSGLFVRDSALVPKAAVALLPDWRGQSSLARDHANFLVSLGCSVVISDLYGDGFNPTSPDQVGAMVQRLMERREDRGCWFSLKAICDG